MPRWTWILLISVAVLAIVIAGLAFSLPTSTISKQADELDNAHLYNLGGILRNLACTRGYGEACFHLGFIYDIGEGVAADYSKAAALYSKACDAGSATGCGNLGVMYEGYGLA
ncbi:MAG TPA: tetratricopeptide repeat protein, partial [Terracidiphilus sp.]|nr:tetratricopeptide repeat protein [Terracidiphilus sp.]